MALPRCSAEDSAAPTAREPLEETVKALNVFGAGVLISPTIYVGRPLISGVDQDKAATVVSAATTSSANR